MSKKHPGYCALCGKYFDDLSFEHIPPKSAFNNNPAKGFSGDELIGNNSAPWITDGLQYENMQKGMGLYSLCHECNNNTGSWYTSEYQKFALIFSKILKQSKNQSNVGVKINNVYPLQIIKQVISMFCSINKNIIFSSRNAVQDKEVKEMPTILQTMIGAQYALVNASNLLEELKKFVLDKRLTGLDCNKYKLCIYQTDSKICKYNGLSSVMNLNNNTFVTMSEITAYPFGFILYFNPPEDLNYKGVDITCFSSCNYDDIADIYLPLTLYEVNSWMPLDYRDKAKILKCIDDTNKFSK